MFFYIFFYIKTLMIFSSHFSSASYFYFLRRYFFVDKKKQITSLMFALNESANKTTKKMPDTEAAHSFLWKDTTRHQLVHIPELIDCESRSESNMIPFRRSHETINAMKEAATNGTDLCNEVAFVTCLCCNIEMCIISDADYCICPTDETIWPVKKMLRRSSFTSRIQSRRKHVGGIGIGIPIDYSE